MSNETQERKLKPHQRKIWTDAFKASMSHVSIEAAERKAWQAVDICERVGAFHESMSSQPIDADKPTIDLSAAWNFLGETLQGCAESAVDWEDRLASAMVYFQKGEMTLADFKTETDLIFRDSSD